MASRRQGEGVKTSTVCKYHLAGNCSKGAQCTFVHGFDDVKKADNPLRKTKLCRNHFINGKCPYRENCDFAHGMVELKCTTEGASLYSLIDLPELRDVENKYYKTQVCKHYFKKGKCWMEEECRFAHDRTKIQQ